MPAEPARERGRPSYTFASGPGKGSTRPSPHVQLGGRRVGKPVAPQTASVGVSTTRFERDEGAVIRHNMGWTFVLLGYLILIGVGFYLFFPSAGALP